MQNYDYDHEYLFMTVDEIRQTAERNISDFLMSAFDDERLSNLQEDAIAGKVPFVSCTECLVGHCFTKDTFTVDWTGEMYKASSAYNFLAYDESCAVPCRDVIRMQRLIPLIDAEIERRARLRAEAVRAAVETCKVTAEGLATMPLCSDKR